MGNIFNFYLSSGEFLSAWRKVNILFISKIKNHEYFSHYRPIFIPPFLSKVLEWIIHSQLCAYIYKHNILSQYQFGSRKILSFCTVTGITKNCDICVMDKKQLSILPVLHFNKTFNTIDLEFLLAVFRFINISNEVAWFRNFLYDRYQFVRVP